MTLSDEMTLSDVTRQFREGWDVAVNEPNAIRACWARQGTL